MQTVQYQIRQRAQPGNTHLERTKALFKTDHNILPPALLQRYLPYIINVNLGAKSAILESSESTT